MSKSNFSEDFKRDAVRQITERGYPVAEVSQRLGVSQHSLYEWKKKFAASNAKGSGEVEEIKRLKHELARVTEERDIPKKSGRVFRQGCKVKYAFIALHRLQFSVRTMCRLLRVHPSGFYAWLKNPLSRRTSEDKRQTDLLQKAWEESGKVYGYRKLHDDLLDQGEMCCPNRVARLTRLAGIKAQIGYKRRPGIYGGRPSVAIGNTLDRQFDVAAPDKVWVTDITYIRTCEGFSYLAVVIDLYSRRVIGWALQGRQTTDVVLQALLMAVWRRKPKDKVLIHSDQGSQFTSMDWASFLKHHNLVHSMSRRGNCHDNAVAESFFNLLKRERIRRKVYRSRDEARQDVFDYIEMFYNPKRKHVRNGMLSPVEFEKQQKI
ncbi:IS3 family transposase [Rhizobium rhizogenes]|uniref:IS3 family transposase n=2 Tax=Rhizobium rhizogenes TaxID=359 RepID=UPI0011462851|nr:IS3 family transposase [Rhizobium rhizogenes]NTF72403.1 IS3 family transposase [Rhizobium rhizogenes]NTH48841.1 IS3 family transposase [Rhizobium rhizogenes]NTH61724.1 IS3 family transposase [Rhizobium rhizogenes]NTH93350.1 IS3 family transposase [Rhizobium rhizogenes]QUE84087.1 IS3 family transposase [Rhizobium rhizogenes]